MPKLNECARCGHAAHPGKKCPVCMCRNNKGKVTQHPVPPMTPTIYTLGTSVGITTTEQLLDFHADLCEKARAIMERKNRDYGSQEKSDPFANFHMFEEIGIMVRMSDKLSRLNTILRRGDAAVKEETVEDTALDLLNYAVLLLGYRHNKSLEGKK